MIIQNPRLVTDDFGMELYKKSNLPEELYYKAMDDYAVRGYIKTTRKIFGDKVNKEYFNIEIHLNSAVKIINIFY